MHSHYRNPRLDFRLSVGALFVDQPDEHPNRALTMTVLSLISIAGGSLSEDALWKQLETLGVHADDENHPKFGNVRNTLGGLIKQRYLIREKTVGNDGDKYNLELAEVALNEVGQENIDKFVSHIMQGAWNEDDDNEIPATEMQ